MVWKKTDFRSELHRESLGVLCIYLETSLRWRNTKTTHAKCWSSYYKEVDNVTLCAMLSQDCTMVPRGFFADTVQMGLHAYKGHTKPLTSNESDGHEYFLPLYWSSESKYSSFTWGGCWEFQENDKEQNGSYSSKQEMEDVWYKHGWNNTPSPYYWKSR